MNLLFAGGSLWVIAQLLASLGTRVHQGLIDRLWAGQYHGVFWLTILFSLGLIVMIWRTTPEEYLFVVPAWSRLVEFGLMMIANFLFGASHGKSIVRRFVRHPVLMAILFGR